MPNRAQDTTAVSDAAAASGKIWPAEHTPLPWEWWTSNSHVRLTSRVTRSDGDVLSAYVARDGHPCINVREINMEYIVRACNAYPTLVYALRQIAKPALGGKQQQYAAQEILRELGELK